MAAVTSSIVDPTASSAIPGPSRPSKASRASDSIINTTTAPSSRTKSGSKKANSASFDLEIVVASVPGRRISTATSNSAASTRGKARASISSSKPNESSGDETDCDALPRETARKKISVDRNRRRSNSTTMDNRARSNSAVGNEDAPLTARQKNRTRTTTIVRASPPPLPLPRHAGTEDPPEAVPASDASEDPLLINTTAKPVGSKGSRRGSGSKVSKARRQLVVESDEEPVDTDEVVADQAPETEDLDADEIGPTRLGPQKRGGGSRASTCKRVAVSEDEDGALEALGAARRAMEHAEELDDDYGGSRPRPKKGKAAADGATRKRTRSSKQDTAGDEAPAAAGPSTSTLRRPPTITKDEATAPRNPATGSVPPETTRSGRPTRNKPKRLGTNFVDESPVRRAAPAPPAPASRGGKVVSAPTAAAAAAAAVVAGGTTAPVSTRTASKKRSIVHDSEDDEEEAPGIAGDTIPAAVDGGVDVADQEPAPEKAQAPAEEAEQETAAPVARRGKLKQRKQIASSSDAEDEGAASDATSAINTGDEFDNDSEEGEEPVRGGSKGKQKPAPPDSAGSVAGTLSTSMKPGGSKRPRLSTSPNRSRGRSASTEERIEQMMKAAAEDEDQSLLKPASRSSTVSRVGRIDRGATTDAEGDEAEAKASPDRSEDESKASHSRPLVCRTSKLN